MNEPIETVALEQLDIIDRMTAMLRELIKELSQYRRMDEEEKMLEELLVKMGGGAWCGSP